MKFALKSLPAVSGHSAVSDVEYVAFPLFLCQTKATGSTLCRAHPGQPSGPQNFNDYTTISKTHKGACHYSFHRLLKILPRVISDRLKPTWALLNFQTFTKDGFKKIKRSPVEWFFCLLLFQRYYEVKRHLCFCGSLHCFITLFRSSNSPLEAYTLGRTHDFFFSSSFTHEQCLIIINTHNKLPIITCNCQ